LLIGTKTVTGTVTVGGVYLTRAYVCRLCSHRVGMSHAQFHQHADYPRHYQEGGLTVEPEPAPTEKESSRTRSWAFARFASFAHLFPI